MKSAIVLLFGLLIILALASASAAPSPVRIENEAGM